MSNNNELTKEMIEAKRNKIIWNLSNSENMFGIHPANLDQDIFVETKDGSNEEVDAFLSKYSKRKGDLENLSVIAENFYMCDTTEQFLKEQGFKYKFSVGRNNVPVFMREPIKVKGAEKKGVGSLTESEFSLIDNKIKKIMDYGHENLLLEAKFVVITGNVDSRNVLLTAMIHRNAKFKECLEIDIKKIFKIEEDYKYVIA